MAQLTFPTAAVKATVTRWGRLGRVFAPTCVVGTPAQNSYAATISGLTVTIGRGTTGVAEAIVAGFMHQHDTADWSVVVPANTNATLPRVDRIVLRWNPATEAITLAHKQGTPAASPVAPALDQVDAGTWEMPLHRFVVPANSGAPVTGLIDERPWYFPSAEPRIMAHGSSSSVQTVTSTEARITDAGLTVSPYLLPGRLYEVRWSSLLAVGGGGGNAQGNIFTRVRAVAGTTPPVTTSTSVASGGFGTYTTAPALSAQIETAGYFTVQTAGLFTFSPFAACSPSFPASASGTTLIVRDAGPASGVVGVAPTSLA